VTPGPSELRIERAAGFDAPRPLRHALQAFLAAVEIDPQLRDDIVLAAGEALANAVEHAYDAQQTGTVRLHAYQPDAQTLVVDVFDRGVFVAREGGTPGRGFGLRIVRAIARSVSIDTEGGTRISMVFDAPQQRASSADATARGAAASGR
jgi:anti-sigma regulatory factor (Ser/Thr protein kinase)